MTTTKIGSITLHDLSEQVLKATFDEKNPKWAEYFSDRK